MLRLGQHYSEQWEDEDIYFYDSVLPHAGNLRDKQLPAASIIPRLDPATLNNDDLLVEEVGTVPSQSASLLPCFSLASCGGS